MDIDDAREAIRDLEIQLADLKANLDKYPLGQENDKEKPEYWTNRHLAGDYFGSYSLDSYQEWDAAMSALLQVIDLGNSVGSLTNLVLSSSTYDNNAVWLVLDEKGLFLDAYTQESLARACADTHRNSKVQEWYI